MRGATSVLLHVPHPLAPTLSANLSQPFTICGLSIDNSIVFYLRIVVVNLCKPTFSFHGFDLPQLSYMRMCSGIFNAVIGLHLPNNTQERYHIL